MRQREWISNKTGKLLLPKSSVHAYFNSAHGLSIRVAMIKASNTPRFFDELAELKCVKAR